MPVRSLFLYPALIAVCLVFLSGCSGFQKPPLTKTYYDLDIPAVTTDQGSGTKKAAILLVKEFAISPEFDSHAFVYRIKKNQYATDFYNEFSAYPARLITEEIKEGLFSTKYFAPSTTRYKGDIAFRISGKITRLYADLQTPGAPESVMEIRFTLEKKDDTGFKKIHTGTYPAREKLSNADPALIAAGWGKGLGKILLQFIEDIRPVL